MNVPRRPTMKALESAVLLAHSVREKTDRPVRKVTPSLQTWEQQFTTRHSSPHGLGGKAHEAKCTRSKPHVPEPVRHSFAQCEAELGVCVTAHDEAAIHGVEAGVACQLALHGHHVGAWARRRLEVVVARQLHAHHGV